MTNKISSAEQAIEALIKLKTRDASVRVEFGAWCVNFSLDGHIADVDSDILEVRAQLESGGAPVCFTLSGLRVSRFEGDFREDETGMFLWLDITRPQIDRPDDAIRVHITGSWSTEPPKPLLVH